MKNFIPEELIEEVRINNDIVDVVSEYVKLERKGKNLVGLCPFHKEKTPSFNVVQSGQFFHCFGCGKGGNVITFIKTIENLDYFDAVRMLAERARIQLPEGESEEERQKAKLKEEIVKVNTEAARYFFRNLSDRQNENARLYLQKRGLNYETIKSFGLGFSSQDWDSLYKYLASKGFPIEAIEKSGLVVRKKAGGYCDNFRNRIMFPILDVRGRVIGFGGRVMDDSLPKYKNSPETLVYNKGNNLYALNIAKNYGRKSIVIVEGYMDVISLHLHGIQNAVASLGTALTISQGRLLKKYCEEVIISYDADTAGQSATMRGLDLLSDIGCNVRVLIIPEGKDPDEFVRKNGPDEFGKLMDKAISLIEYKVKSLKKQVDTETTEGKISFLKKMAVLLSKVGNRVEREMYINKLAREYEISSESLITEVYKAVNPKTGYRAASTVPYKVQITKAEKDDKSIDKLSQLEKMLLALLCIDNSLYKQLECNMKPSDFEDPENGKLAEEIYNRIMEKKGIVVGELLNILDDVQASTFTRLVQQQSSYDDTSKAVADILRNIELLKLERRQQEIFKLLNDKGNIIEGNVEKLKLELNSIIMKKRILQTNS